MSSRITRHASFRLVSLPQISSPPILSTTSHQGMHTDWPPLGEGWPVTTPTVAGRKFKVLGSAEKTLHIPAIRSPRHHCSEKVSTRSRVMWLTEAMSGSGLVGGRALTLCTVSTASLPDLSEPCPRGGVSWGRN